MRGVRRAAAIVMVAGLAWCGATALAQDAGKRFVMPKVTPRQFTQQGADSVRIWAKGAIPVAKDRAAATREVRKALRMHERFRQRVTSIYPQDQLEWILITDDVADTLSVQMGPIARAYVNANKNELLTEGRQFFELEIAKIPGPPPRLHGFNLVLLSNWAYAQVDSILARGDTRDVAGLEDGVLRYLAEWCHLYDEVHKDAKEIYQTRLNQQDWVIARLKDNCGKSNWQLTEQYFAALGMDSTFTPPKEMFAHEFHIKARDCDDSRVIQIAVPNFHDMQLQVAKELELMQQQRNPDGTKR